MNTIFYKHGFGVRDISLQVGFNDPSNFAKVFKDHTELSPAEFQMQQQVSMKWVITPWGKVF